MTSPPNGLDTLSHALLECCGLALFGKRSLTDLTSYVDLQQSRLERFSRFSFGSVKISTDTSAPFWTDSATSNHGEAMVIATYSLYHMRQQAA